MVDILSPPAHMDACENVRDAMHSVLIRNVANLDEEYGLRKRRRMFEPVVSSTMRESIPLVRRICTCRAIPIQGTFWRPEVWDFVACTSTHFRGEDFTLRMSNPSTRLFAGMCILPFVVNIIMDAKRQLRHVSVKIHSVQCGFGSWDDAGASLWGFSASDTHFEVKTDVGRPSDTAAHDLIVQANHRDGLGTASLFMPYGKRRAVEKIHALLHTRLEAGEMQHDEVRAVENVFHVLGQCGVVVRDGRVITGQKEIVQSVRDTLSAKLRTVTRVRACATAWRLHAAQAAWHPSRMLHVFEEWGSETFERRATTTNEIQDNTAH